MNIRLLIITLSLPFFACCQPSPVGWKADARRVSDSVYSISITGSVAAGWHVYASGDEALGLEPLGVSWTNENIKKEGELYTKIIALDFKDPVFENRRLKIIEGANICFVQQVKISGTVPSSFNLTLNGFASNNKEFIPINELQEVKLEGGTDPVSGIKLSTIDLAKPVAECGDQVSGSKNLLTIFFLGFLGGLIALLTPCVFPMIPVTVSFFTNKGTTKKQGVRNGVSYGFFILLIYLLASLPFHLAGNMNPEVFNTISTSAVVNIIFFVIFIFFAISFFGLFEISLPPSLANSAGAKGGIFFMALTLVIVSFSCTGPILGSLLVSSLSADNGAWQLTAGMGGFGVALALPFGLFAMFPQWLRKLPKSGSWMDTVKKVLAFVELALAFKFLSNADLVKHWGLLKREVFIAVWIIIAIALGLYLGGAFSRAPQFYISPKVKRSKSWGKPVMAAIAFGFAVYLLPGLTNTKYANLRLLSGFPPPLSYSIYGSGNLAGKGLEPDVINDYDKALKLSREQHKPLLIDFTGWACVNCRRMEEQVWTNGDIKTLIKDKYILVSLYVDDRGKLPFDKQFIYRQADGNKKDIRTLGDKWATFQSENFSYVSQPLYVVLSPDEKLLNHPVGYTPDEKEYSQWLECGLQAYEDSRKLLLNSSQR